MSSQVKAELLQKSCRNRAGCWTSGMALFSMFFGAGNLIFPLLVGLNSGTHTSYAVIGLGCSAVFFPLLGLMAMLFYEGDLRSFLSRLGVIPASILLLVLQLAMGPLACVPRLITLMHASIRCVIPEMSLLVFSIFICLAMFFLALRSNRMVHLLGVVLTPLFLAMLAVLVLLGISQGTNLQPSLFEASHHFQAGLKGGYQTMDLISSLLFATIIMPYLRKGTEDMDPDAVKAQVRKTMLGASAIAALLLMASYIGLTFLAAHHASNLPPLPPEEVLQAIAIRVLGPVGSLIAVSIVFLACLTTAMSLVAVCSEYVRSTFFLKKKESILPLVITLACAGLMSNLGFSGLMKIVGPAMQILYPALIALCVTNIAYNLYRVRSVKVPVYAALGLGFMGFILAY